MMTRKDDQGTTDAAQGSPGYSPSGADFHAIFDAAPYGMLVADQGGTITRANMRLEAMFGYAAGALVGQRSDVLFPDRYRERHAGMRGVYHARPQARVIGFDRDLTGLRTNGEEFPLEISLCPISGPEGALLFCATIIDVTDRERTALRLRESETMLGEIAQAISRDIHQQIHEVATVIAFRAENPDTPLPVELERSMRRLTECLSGVEHLLGDLSIYTEARHFPMRSETIDLGAVVDEAIAREAPGASVSIDVSVPRETFEGARRALSGVLRSLISNSIKHHDREDIRIDIQARLEADHCLIDYADDGPGIPDAAQQRVFRLFETLSGDSEKGSGMGLAITRRMVEAHGASISLIGREGGTRGARFRIWWPRYPRADRAA